jgi:hypothetical protein
MTTLGRAVVTVFVTSAFGSAARSDDWRPREDVGVAAVDTRTGTVLWEVWRTDEVPTDASPEERAAVAYLLAATGASQKPLPKVTTLPSVPVAGLKIDNPWPASRRGRPEASEGATRIYYRHSYGVIALDRQTRNEVWRLLTSLDPSPSVVLEVGDLRAFVQIGSFVPATLNVSLDAGPNRFPMKGLEPHTLEQRVAAAVLLHRYGDGYLRPLVRRVADQLRDGPHDPARATAAKAVESLLDTWPKTRDRQRLLDPCVSALLRSDDDPFRTFPWPGAHRLLVWCLLQELIYGSPTDGYSRQGYNYAYHTGWTEQPVRLTAATRAALADHCRRVVADGPDGERPFAASVLLSTSVGWDRLSDDERKKLFLSADPSAWRWAALSLAKNGRRDQLMEWATERPADDHLDTLWVLHHDQPKEWADAELAFWVACARRNPGGVAVLLRSRAGPHPTAFREPIRAYLSGEAAKPTGTQPGYSLVSAVHLLDSWKNPDDTPLLLACLKHPSSVTATRYQGTGGTVVRQYIFRDNVRHLLVKRGVQVPADVVYEEVVGPAK